MARRRGGEEQWIVKYLHWRTEEDDWEQGAVPGTGQTVLDESNLGTFDSFDELRQNLTERFGLPEDDDSWAIFGDEDGRIEVQFTVDEDNQQPSPRDLALWKQGRKKMWTANVSIYVEVGVVRAPSSDELTKMTGLQEI